MVSCDNVAARSVPWALLAAAALYFAVHAVALLVFPLMAANITAEPARLAAAAIVLYSASAAVLDIPAARLLRRWGLPTLAGGSAILAAAALAAAMWVSSAVEMLASATVLGAATAGLMGPILSSLATAASGNQQRVQSVNAAAQRTGALLMGLAAIYVLADPASVGVAVLVGVAASAGLLATVITADVRQPAAAFGISAAPPSMPRREIGCGMLLNGLIPLLMIFGASFLPLAVLVDGSAGIGPGEIAAGLIGREVVAILLSVALVRWHRVQPRLLVTSATALGAVTLAATTWFHQPAVFVSLFSVHGATIAAAIVASNIHLAAGSTITTRPRAFALGGIASRLSALVTPVILGAVSFTAPQLILITSSLVMMSLIAYLVIGRLPRGRA